MSNIQFGKLETPEGQSNGFWPVQAAEFAPPQPKLSTDEMKAEIGRIRARRAMRNALQEIA